MTRRFSGNGQWIREIAISEDGRTIFDIETEIDEPVFQPLLPLMRAAKIDYCELVVEFSVKGYHTPSSMYGGPDRMGWAEEGDEERTIEGVYLWANQQKIKIPDAIANPILTKFDKEIEEKEYKADEYDPNDREPDFESVIKTVSELITEDIDVTK